MSPTTYADVLARNVRAARSRAGLQQEPLAGRMRALGYGAWLRQTVANVEKGRRRLTAEEIFALSLCLQTSIAALMAPADEDKMVDLPSGDTVPIAFVQRLTRGYPGESVEWDGVTPRFFDVPPRIAELWRRAGETDEMEAELDAHSRALQPPEES